MLNFFPLGFITINYLTDAVVAEDPVLGGFFFAFFLCGRFEEFPEM